MARQRYVIPSRDIVIIVLREMAKMATESTMSFTKAEFIKTYWRLRKQRKIPFVKIETLLRTLRQMAAESSFLKYKTYGSKKGGKYILDVIALP